MTDFTPLPGQESTAREPETISFQSLAACIKCNLAESQLRKVNPASVAFWLLLKFRSEHAPSASATDDQEKFAKFALETMRIAKVPTLLMQQLSYDKLQQFFCLSLTEPLVYISACLGGILAQEVIKCITKRDMPQLNTITVSGPAAQVMAFPAPKYTPPPKVAPMNGNSVDITDSIDVAPIKKDERIDLD